MERDPLETNRLCHDLNEKAARWTETQPRLTNVYSQNLPDTVV